MLIDPALWPKLHGASTHFPMGLTMAAALFEVAAAFLPVESPHRRSLRAAGYYTIILGALGTWRGLVGEKASPGASRVYLVALLLVSGLMSGAGYWGGELILNS